MPGNGLIQLPRYYAILLAAILVLGGCASNPAFYPVDQRMEMVEREQVPAASDNATVIFLRPSRIGRAVPADIYDVTDNRTEYVATATGFTQVVAEFEPGERRLMVVSEAADFMRADLTAGETYYVVVSPRMGIAEARFTLYPVKDDENARFELQSGEIEQWREKLQPIRTAVDRPRRLPADELEEVTKLQREYWAEWQEKPEDDKAVLTLEASDGV